MFMIVNKHYISNTFCSHASFLFRSKAEEALNSRDQGPDGVVQIQVTCSVPNISQATLQIKTEATIRTDHETEEF